VKRHAAMRRVVPAVNLRSAWLADVPELLELMAPFVATGDLLPRGEYDLSRHIKEYVVAHAADGSLVGCASLKNYSPILTELAGLAVREDHQGSGLGRALVQRLVDEARATGLRTVFALTRKPLFFLRMGFEAAEKLEFPEKVWADCQRCPRQDACDEIAVVMRLG